MAQTESISLFYTKRSVGRFRVCIIRLLSQGGQALTYHRFVEDYYPCSPSFTLVKFILDYSPELIEVLNISNYCLVYTESVKNILTNICPEMEGKFKLFSLFFQDDSHMEFLTQFDQAKERLLAVRDVTEEMFADEYSTD